MRELTFVGLSSDGRHLLLMSRDAGEYLLRIDDRLASALRREGERLRGQPTDLGPMPANPTPREIQERIRAGMSVNAIAAAAGVGEESVARFATAVLAERAFIADRAGETTIRFEDRALPLARAVAERLTPTGIESDRVRWDAWRRADGDWTVVCAYPFDQGERIATFGFDPTARRVWPDDDAARWIVESREDPPPGAADKQEPINSPAPDTSSWDPDHPAARAHQRRARATEARAAGGPPAEPERGPTGSGQQLRWEDLLLGDVSTDHPRDRGPATD